MTTLKERITKVEVEVENNTEDIKQVNKKLWWMSKTFVVVTLGAVTSLLVGIITFIMNKYL
jgi:hypothetical protein